MPRCANCGAGLVRSHRSRWEKLFYTAVFRCRQCSAVLREPLPSLSQFTLHCQCPRCGNPDPVLRTTTDKIDRVLYTPFRLLHRMLGGKLYHCVYCRLQFHDLRRRKEVSRVA